MLRPPASQTLIFIPTYNERENVEKICGEVLKCGLGAEILFIDDNSPDGTGEILDRLAKDQPSVHVLHRAAKSGIGSAHREAIRWAYAQGYTTLITMDCDFTHHPKYLAEFLQESQRYDVVVGSRYLQKDSLKGWNVLRFGLTQWGHFLTKHLLKIPQDATGAFRAYRLDRLPEDCFTSVQSRGYSFFFESLWWLNRDGFLIHEIPIDLPPRTYGTSKMKVRDALESVGHLIRLYWSGPSFKKMSPLTSWDAYWTKKTSPLQRVYDRIAAGYRKFLIKPALNHIATQFFPPGSRILHAGCGSGQVDLALTQWLRIIALDLSAPALGLYGQVHGIGSCRVQGDIFHLPLRDQAVDGIYNLGVMEHFTRPQIQKILEEFHRVLRPEGKIVLFWPPTFGTSVLFLQAVHFILNRVLKKSVQLHPPELTQLRGRAHAQHLLVEAGFQMIQYQFSIRDFFTYAIVVASKMPPCQEESLLPAQSEAMCQHS